MARAMIDLTGRGGLAPGFMGDLNDTTATPNLRYLGTDTQVADGIYNPLRIDGFMAPANNVFTDLTGTISNEIISRAYSSSSDKLFLAQNGTQMSYVSGLNGTAITSDFTISGSLKDIELYEINGEEAIIFAYLYEQTAESDNINIGYRCVDSARGSFPLAAKVYESGVGTASENIAPAGNERLAQKFSVTDFATSGSITGVRLRVKKRTPGNTENWTLKVGIQGDSAGRPDGTYVTNASVTVDANTLPDEYEYTYFDFGNRISLSGTKHIVVEATSFGDISGSEGMSWMRSAGGETQYANGEAQQYISAAWADAAGTSESYDFALVMNRNSFFVTDPDGSGTYKLEERTAENVFMQKADNGLCYIFTNNRVHKMDGGITGGDVGAFTADVLVFPRYMNCVDATDTNSLMYIGIQSSATSSGSDYRTFGADTMGVYQWDRVSTVASTRNFMPIYGAREIRKVFVTADGDLRVITIGEDRFTEIRGLVNGKLQVLHRLGINAYPGLRDSLDFLNNMAVWLGVDGVIYAYGRLPSNTKEGIYKIGYLGTASGTRTTGVLQVGHSESSQSRQGVFLSWKDTTPAIKLQKWYPHGVGTISSVAQTGHQGDVYSLVQHLPYLSNVKNIMITCVPYGTASNSTTVATIKFYKNMSSTPFMTKTVTRNDILKGYLAYEINRQYVNTLQLEIEWANQTLGTNDFCPAWAVFDYEASKTIR